MEEQAEQVSLRNPLFATVLYPRFRKAAREHGENRYRVEVLAGLSGRVLELGCGDGENFALYPATVTELVGVEPEENLRERAEQALPRPAARCERAEAKSHRRSSLPCSSDSGLRSSIPR